MEKIKNFFRKIFESFLDIAVGTLFIIATMLYEGLSFGTLYKVLPAVVVGIVATAVWGEFFDTTPKE